MGRRNPDWERTPLSKMVIWMLAPGVIVLILGLFIRHY